MDNRSTFLYRAGPLRAMGGRGRVDPASQGVQAGRLDGAANPSVQSREAMVSGAYGLHKWVEPSRHEKPLARDVRARTANRHRWAGRVDPGGRETPR
jgi:hypothetical protein